MRWRNRRQSSNVEDRRGKRGGFGLPFPMPGRRKGGGISIWLIIIALVAIFVFDINPLSIFGGLGGLGGMQPKQTQTTPENAKLEDDLSKFAAVILADTENYWDRVFASGGKTYKKPKLVLFSGFSQSACGFAQAAMGPFYCQQDSKIYLDLSFYHDLRSRHGVTGDFPMAYVISHEVAHHVQNLSGTLGKVTKLRMTSPKSTGNKLSVMLELQADCYAGAWAHYNRRNLDEGDIREALQAASAIGDDRLQKQSTGYVVPDSFTHGSSEQRMRWFAIGYKDGDTSKCNTFAAEGL